MSMTLDHIRTLISEGLAKDEAVRLLDAYIADNPSDDSALALRGLQHWSLQHRREAINDYLAAIAINPDSPARAALQSAREILDYYNKDIYNP